MGCSVNIFHGVTRCILPSYSFFISKRVVLWHQEVASFPFSFLMNSSWLLVFLFHIFYILFSGLFLKCWKGIHFSHYFYLSFNFLFFGIIILFHFWFRDLLREDYKKVEVFCIILFLVFLIFVFSEGILFVSFFWSSFPLRFFSKPRPPAGQRWYKNQPLPVYNTCKHPSRVSRRAS